MSPRVCFIHVFVRYLFSAFCICGAMPGIQRWKDTGPVLWVGAQSRSITYFKERRCKEDILEDIF